ncbi:MAG TPA: hypothetical protein VFF16_03350 [Telluria sp.]|nr:hypothetical protein [Telluria sp.]
MYTEAHVAYTRRALWLALTVLVLLGGVALALNAAPGTTAARMAGTVLRLFPLALLLALAGLRVGLADAPPRGAALRALLADEWRQHSLRRATRNALAAVLLAQPVLAVLLSMADPSQPLVLMAGLSALTAAVAGIGSMLWYDR